MKLRTSAGHRLLGIRGAWAAVAVLCLCSAVFAREEIIIQKSATNTQLRAAETYLDQANPTTVDGGKADLDVMSYMSFSGNNSNQRSIVKFDFSAIPNVGIKSATLTLTVVTDPYFLTRTYQAYAVTSYLTQQSATWNTRAADLAWGAAGGDFGGTPTATASVSPTSTTVSWNITPDVQNWFEGTPNYGTLIKDSSENFPIVPIETVFDSNAATNLANAPSLTVYYVQNVSNLAATAASNQVKLSWAYPAAIGTIVEPNVGVLILRRASQPVAASSAPTDGNDPGLCATIGSSVVVYDNSSNSTSFTDNSTNDSCGAPANGTMYYYKVFMRDSANNYSTSGTPGTNSSAFTAEISAMPSATAPQNSNWMAATYSTTLAPPSLIPGSVVMMGSQSNLMFAVNATTGSRAYPPVSLGGAITGRSPVIDASDSSLGVDVIYVVDQSGLAYAVAADTGQTLWVVDPIGGGGEPFMGAGATMLKFFASTSYTLTHDLFVVGTRNSGTTTSNEILGIDGNTGATLWQTIGNTGSVPAMDIINSTPLISYLNTAVWVTSHSNGSTTQPSLWELNANNGAVLATDNLGNIDSSPVLTADQKTLFVGNNAGTLYAVNAQTGAVLKIYAGGDGAIVDYPLVYNSASPYVVIFSGSTKVHAVQYNVSTNTFTSLWNTTINSPSAPIGISGLTDVYVGSDDGMIHRLNSATGAQISQIAANTGQPGYVGDPSLDLTLSRIYVSTTDQRLYAFPFPF